MRQKAVLIIAILLFTSHLTWSGNDKPIQVQQLPKAAQEFFKEHFAQNKVALAKKESDWFDCSYKIIFTNGSSVSFDSKGNWEEVDCKKNAVPDAIIPTSILRFVKSHYPESPIVKIDKEDRGYEVKLLGNVELEFNKKFELVDFN